MEKLELKLKNVNFMQTQNYIQYKGEGVKICYATLKLL